MNGQSNERRLNALIGKICDDQIDPSELQELEAILSDDPAAIQQYVESVDLHTRLHRQQGVNTEVAEVAKTLGVDGSLPRKSWPLPLRRVPGLGLRFPSASASCWACLREHVIRPCQSRYQAMRWHNKSRRLALPTTAVGRRKTGRDLRGRD